MNARRSGSMASDFEDLAELPPELAEFETQLREIQLADAGFEVCAPTESAAVCPDATLGEVRVERDLLGRKHFVLGQLGIALAIGAAVGSLVTYLGLRFTDVTKNSNVVVLDSSVPPRDVETASEANSSKASDKRWMLAGNVPIASPRSSNRQSVVRSKGLMPIDIGLLVDDIYLSDFVEERQLPSEFWEGASEAPSKVEKKTVTNGSLRRTMLGIRDPF